MYVVVFVHLFVWFFAWIWAYLSRAPALGNKRTADGDLPAPATAGVGTATTGGKVG